VWWSYRIVNYKDFIMIHINKFTAKVLDDLANYSVSIMRGELLKQDHDYTLKLTKSIRGKRRKTSTGRKVEIVMEDYGIDIDKGYTAETAKNRLARIGFDSYVDQLRVWWIEKKGADEEVAEILAQGTLRKHLERGYRSKRSGGSQGFIDYASGFTEKAASDILGNRDLFTIALYDELKSLGGKNVKVTIKEVAGGNSNITFGRNFEDIF
jgi:hypothetical protein